MGFFQRLSVKTKIIGLLSLLAVMLIGAVVFLGGGTGDKSVDKAVKVQVKKDKQNKKTLNSYKKDGKTMVTYEDLVPQMNDMSDEHPDYTTSNILNALVKKQGNKLDARRYQGIINHGLIYTDGLTTDQSDIMSREYREFVNLDGMAGLNYREVMVDPDTGTVSSNNNGIDYYTDGGYLIQPLSDGFLKSGDAHIGYPVGVPVQVDGKNFLIFYTLVYFDKDMSWKDLRNFTIKMSFQGQQLNNDNTDLGSVKDRSKYYGNFSNQMNQDYLNDFTALVKNYTVSDESSKTFADFPLLKGGMLMYCNFIQLSMDTSMYQDGEFKLNVNGTDIKMMSDSSLNAKATKASTYDGFAKYNIKIYK